MDAPVYWITGFSGAGKTTVATELASLLRTSGLAVLQLDGDLMRQILSRERDDAPEDRRALAMIYSRMCREVSRQGITVVCATISMFHAVRRWNRDHIPQYREIFLRVPIEELRRRDPKGLYRAGSHEKGNRLVGVEIEAELPERPDVVIDNHAGVSAAMAAKTILDAFARAPR
jgi:adenylylsulfate kinase-like enzyme